LILGTLGLAGTCAHAAAPTEEEELSMAFGDKSFVSIATGSKVPVARAPSIATVITAEDIVASGATDLDELLETVPGLHVARSTLAHTPMYTVRGIRGSITNPQVLMLVNGMPRTQIYAGDRGINWGGMPVQNIARIEVIRGPGSALYGADAYAGVINIITKTKADIGGTRLGGYGGSFKSAGGWLLHGGRLGDVDVAAYLSIDRTDGARPTVEADAQTGLDAIFAPFGVPPVSLAPGPPNYARKIVDGALDFSLEAWRLPRQPVALQRDLAPVPVPGRHQPRPGRLRRRDDRRARQVGAPPAAGDHRGLHRHGAAPHSPRRRLREPRHVPQPRNEELQPRLQPDRHRLARR
jgi:iron complex outermembrane receptor protein